MTVDERDAAWHWVHATYRTWKTRTQRERLLTNKLADALRSLEIEKSDAVESQ